VPGTDRFTLLALLSNFLQVRNKMEKKYRKMKYEEVGKGEKINN
jgi:hypothetical protein